MRRNRRSASGFGLKTTHDRGKGRLHVARFVPDLGMREAERREARSGMRLVALAIPRLLRRGPVVAQTVCPHD